jgi:hypothetical protein
MFIENGFPKSESSVGAKCWMPITFRSAGAKLALIEGGYKYFVPLGLRFSQRELTDAV